MYYSFLKTCVSLIVCIALAECELTVEKGRYSNVVVGFAENVPSDKGYTLLESLKVVLNEASDVLQTAIGIRFSKVTVFIPTSWNKTTESSFSSQANLQPHILVEGVNDTIFGKFPFAHQYGSCGIPGSQLTIPTEFLSSEEFTFPKGKILAREWLKYRYGVFDENGYPNDELYPSYYSIPGTDPKEIKVTDCTNIPLKYNFIGENEGNCSVLENTDASKCMPVPNDDSLNTTTSSLMFFQEKLHSMSHVCGKDEDHKHASRSPNKHNVLCRGQSIWDVLKKSSDFENLEESTESNEIEFEYVQETYPRIVIMWDNTVKMKPMNAPMLQAIRRFLYELPDGSKCALLPFAKDPQGNSAFRDLNNWPEDRKLEVPSNFAANVDGCVSCAITKAKEILMADEAEPEGTIIAIVRSSLTSSEELEKLKQSKVCLKFYVFNKEVLQEYEDHAKSFLCGEVTDFTSVGEKEVFQKVYAEMKALLPAAVGQRISETKHTEYINDENSTVTVPVDRTVEKVMFWIFSNLEDDAVELKFNDKEEKAKVEFRDGETFMGLSYSPQQPGNLEFRITYNMMILTQVSFTSKPGEYLNADVFIYDTTEKESADQMPVIIYASIRFGSYPVQYANVEAVVRTPDNKEFRLDMYDDGKGDPDITKNDGIYSRYFTGFTQEGNYIVEINVKNTGDSTKGGKIHFDENKGFTTCCGSSLSDGRLMVPSLTKEFTGMFRAKGGRPKDGYKPSRIADLKIGETDGDKVILKWSAPGAEADSGTVENYEIKYFTSREDAEQHFEEGKLLNVTPTPELRGSDIQIEINFGEFGESATYYIAMRAKSATGKTSDISNIIEVFIPVTEVTTDNGEDTTEDGKNVKSSSPDKTVVGIVIGVILALVVLIILIYLAVYFFVLKPKRKEEKRKEKRREDREMKNPSAENHVQNSSADTRVNSINFIPADAIMKNHKEIERAKAQNKNPPIFREEDFEDRNSSGSNRIGDNNEEEPGYSQVNKIPKEVEPRPPKSPKRTTPV